MFAVDCRFGADYDLLGSAPLHWAVGGGCLRCMLILIARGATIDLHNDKTGWTPLIEGAYQGHWRTLRMLIAAGADLEVKAHEFV